MEGDWERAAEADGGGGAGAGPSSLAVGRGRNGAVREGGAAGEGRPRAESSFGQQQQQQQEHRRVIRWERFLPRRSLRVLLVEHDDSTRHIVTALLRKCSYHVAAIADGLKAWEVLKEKNYNFDLVLSEVEVPSLSGISLLCKIMANECSKNIPVIMMSSHDSVSVVFKCMQKGAVDFLVKPVRKNELRNLWQHVWRRHCSNGFGNGPENFPNNQTASENMSGNHVASNDVSANAGKGSRTGESCDGGDDQSSGSKPLAQNKSSQKQEVSPLVDDKSARVMESQPQLGDDVATLDISPEMVDSEKAKSKSAGLAVTLSVQEITISENAQEQIHFYHSSPRKGKDLGYTRQKGHTDMELRPFSQNIMPCKSPKRINDFIGSVTAEQRSFSAIDNDSERKNALCEATRSSNPINTCPADSYPSWELPLRRPQINGCVKKGFQEKNILNHSAASAFSRYAHTAISLLGQKSGYSSPTICITTRENADKCQLQFDSHDTMNEKPVPFIPDGKLESSQGNNKAIRYHQISCNDEDAEPRGSAPSEDDIGIGSSATKDSVTLPQSQLGMMPLSIPVRAIPFQGFCAGYGPILQPMFYHEPSVPPHGSAAFEQAKCLTSSDQPANYVEHIIPEIQSTTFHTCEEHQQLCLLEPAKRDNAVDTALGDPRRPRVDTCSVEHTDECGGSSRDIVNGSGSNGSGGTADAAVNTITAFEHGNESGLRNFREKGVEHHLSHREAALIKFRLKRKDRCFEKKVRYHSRKMLAEQRPRVKGQFVRQVIVDSNATNTVVDD